MVATQFSHILAQFPQIHPHREAVLPSIHLDEKQLLLVPAQRGARMPLCRLVRNRVLHFSVLHQAWAASKSGLDSFQIRGRGRPEPQDRSRSHSRKAGSQLRVDRQHRDVGSQTAVSCFAYLSHPRSVSLSHHQRQPYIRSVTLQNVFPRAAGPGGRSQPRRVKHRRLAPQLFVQSKRAGFAIRPGDFEAGSHIGHLRLSSGVDPKADRAKGCAHQFAAHHRQAAGISRVRFVLGAIEISVDGRDGPA